MKRSIDDGDPRGSGYLWDCTPVENEIHSYSEMNGLLERLSRDYKSVDLVPIGKTDPVSGKDLDIMALVIKPSGNVREGVMLVGGHHVQEEGGSESVYNIARKLLERRDDNERVRAFLDEYYVAAVPQVNANWYDSGFITGRKAGVTYPYGDIFESQRDIQEYHMARIRTDKMRLERLPELRDSLPDDLTGEVKSMKRFVRSLSKRFGPAIASFDYHETGGDGFRYSIEEDRLVDSPGCPFVYQEQVGSVLEKMKTAFPVAEPRPPWFHYHGGKPFSGLTKELENMHQRERKEYLRAEPWGFSTYMRLKGARSFVSETPSDSELNERIRMNLCATDLVLSDVLFNEY